MATIVRTSLFAMGAILIAQSGIAQNSSNVGQETSEASSASASPSQTSKAEESQKTAAPDNAESPATPVGLVPPQLLEFVEADYPEQAKAEKLEASVVLVIDIDVDGNVENVEVSEPSDYPDYGFEDAAADAALNFKFQPATENGEPIPVRISYRYRFMFQEEVREVLNVPEGEPVENFVGRLLERGTKRALAATIVTIFQGEGDGAVGFDATSDENGYFKFFDIPSGDWKILVEPPGYFPYRATEQVLENQKTNVTLYIEKGRYNPFDVVTVAPRPKKEVSRTSLTVTEIEKIPGAAGDPLAVVQNLPGVARTQQGSGLLVVRGAAPEDTQIFVDGIAVPLIYHFGGLRSIIPAGMLDAIDFYPGNFSAQYGRATGGILDVRIKDLKPEGFDGYFDVSLLDASLFVETPLSSKTSLAIGARRSYIDAILSAAVPDDAGVSFLTAPRYYDGQILLTYRPSDAHRLRFFSFVGDDRLEFLFENPSDLGVDFTAPNINTVSTFYRNLIEYEYVPNERFSNRLRLSGGRNWVSFGAGDLLRFELNTYYGQIRNVSRYKFSDRIALRGGIDYLMVTADIDIRAPQPGKEGDVPTETDFGDLLEQQDDGLQFLYPAAWAELELEPVEGLLIIPGARLDWTDQGKGGARLTPRLTTRYRLSNTWTVKAGAGIFVQTATFDETSRVFGNPDLDYERAFQYSAGIEYQPLEHLTIDVTGFYKDLDSLIGRSDGLVVRNGETVPEIYNNETEGRIYGAELLVRHKFANNFFGWLSYTYSRSERKDPGATDYRLFDFDQTHIFAALGTFQLPRNWEAGFRWRYVSGVPSTPFVGAVFNSDQDLYEPVTGAVNSDRVPAFHQLDIRVDKKWIYDTWVLGAYLDIQNIYNRANPEGFTYNFDYSERDIQQGLPLLPILGLRADF